MKIAIVSLLVTNTWNFDHNFILPLIRASRLGTNNSAEADWHIIDHGLPFGSDPYSARAIYAELERTYPPWNASKRFLLFHFCDHFVDCNYLGRDFRHEDPRYSPASPTRTVYHVVWNGRSDAHDGHCDACFDPAKDIVVPTAHNACGPYCGSTKEELNRLAMWNAQSPRTLFGAHEYVRTWPKRPIQVFWAGQVPPHTNAKDDISGRGLFYKLHHNRTDWMIRSTYNNNTNRFLEKPILEYMRNAKFCYSPPGHIGADHDRYLPALLTGCIPIIPKYVYQSESKNAIHNPFEDIIDWSKIAILVDMDDMHRLPAILAQANVESLRAHAHAVWRRMLWTSVYGSELGEDASEDAIQTLLQVLEARL